MNALRNKVQLIGNLGRDPELRETKNGKKVLSVSLATNESYKNDSGEQVKNTEWHNIVAWGKTAELMSQLAKKGSELAVQGKLTHKTYEDKEGVTRYTSEVVVNEFLLLSRTDMPF